MYRLIALLLVLTPVSLAHATAITDLPGFVTVFGCIYTGNGGTTCLGPRVEEIRSGQVFFDHMQDAIPFRGYVRDTCKKWSQAISAFKTRSCKFG